MSDESQHGPFDLALKEGYFDSLFFDKPTALAVLRTLEAMHPARRPLAEHFLKLRPPDRDYAPELVATIAATLIRNHRANDYELAVARALALLDITHQILDRHKGGNTELGKQLPFGAAMRRITGANTAAKAEERYIGEMLRWGYEYIDDKEVKRIHKPTVDEIKAALAPFRLTGFAPALVDRLREQHLARVGRTRIESVKRKRPEIKIVA